MLNLAHMMGDGVVQTKVTTVCFLM